MARKIRPSKRKGKQTLDATAVKSMGKIGISRKVIQQNNSDTEILLPEWVTSAIFRNTGNVDFELRTDKDDPDNYWSMPKDYQSPIIPVTQSSTIWVKNKGANATLECLFFG